MMPRRWLQSLWNAAHCLRNSGQIGGGPTVMVKVRVLSVTNVPRISTQLPSPATA